MRIQVYLNHKGYPGGLSFWGSGYLTYFYDKTPELHDYSVKLKREKGKKLIEIEFANKDKGSRLNSGSVDLSPSTAKRLARALLDLSYREEGKIKFNVKAEPYTRSKEGVY